MDKWPAYARLSTVAPASHLPTAPTPPHNHAPKGSISIDKGVKIGSEMGVTVPSDLTGKQLLEGATCKWGPLQEAIRDVRVTLARELSRATVLSLSSEEQQLYSPRLPLFGEEVANKFSSKGSPEINEAAKCLSLERPTAAVFHLMRAMEAGIRALAACLGVPDPTKPAERNWAIMLRNIRDFGINPRWPKPEDRMTGDGALFEALYATLDAAKRPWRDPTMHIEKVYTSDEARTILYAVRGFMMSLAARCDENGEPKAALPVAPPRLERAR